MLLEELDIQVVKFGEVEILFHTEDTSWISSKIFFEKWLFPVK